MANPNDFMSVTQQPLNNITNNTTNALTNVISKVDISSTNTALLGIKSPTKGLSGPVFTHDTNNIVVTPPTKAESDINLSTAFVPNILDNYDVVTYHWKLFITTPEASSTGAVFDTNSQIIIAESGVSDLTIDKVEIRSITTPSVECGTGTSTSVKFEIVEPSGAGLVDKIFYEALALGIGNWNVMPFYLQLQFKGRSPETSAADDGTPGPIGNLRWLWTLKLNEIKANVTTVGTRYEFSAIIYDELAQGNANYVLQHPVVLNNLSNFQDAMTKLQNKLNGDQIYRMLGTCSIPDSYKIIVDPTIGIFNITPNNNNTNSYRNNSTSVFEGKNLQVPAGTSIDKVIDNLLANTDEYQTLILNAPTPGANGVPMPQEKSQMKQLWRIITETRPLKFDPMQNNYAREFTIFIVKYDLGVLDVNTFQDTAGADSITAERKRLMTYIKKSILKKKYNYIFTGLNDQIVNFDIKINNAFISSINRMNGIYFNTAMSDKGPVNQNHSEEEGALNNKIRTAISLQNNAETANSVVAQAAIKEATDSNIAANISDDEKKRNIRLLSFQKPEDITNFLTTAQQQGGIDLDGEWARAKLQAKSIATPIKEKTTDQNLSFISDVNIKGPEARKAYSDYVEAIKGRLRPVARADTMHQRQFMGIESNSNSGLQKLSSMFAVALHSPLDVSFAHTSLLIKGDPFWLFPPPTSDPNARIYNSLKYENNPSEAIDNIKTGHTRWKDSANIYGTDNFIIVRFRSPRVFNIDENPDSVDPFSDVEMFSGVFKVTEIVNKFENGLFRQELSCLMDYNLNIINFIDEIESNTKKSDVNTSPADSVNKVNIPGTSIKEPKIMGSTLNITNGLANIGKSITPGGLTQVALSNVPTVRPNILPGLPNIYG